MVKSSIKSKKQENSTVLPVSEKYNIWLDTSLDNLDYEKELQQEYKDLKYNPRELRPIGKEVLNDWFKSTRRRIFRKRSC